MGPNGFIRSGGQVQQTWHQELSAVALVFTDLCPPRHQPILGRGQPTIPGDCSVCSRRRWLLGPVDTGPDDAQGASCCAWPPLEGVLAAIARSSRRSAAGCLDRPAPRADEQLPPLRLQAAAPAPHPLLWSSTGALSERSMLYTRQLWP